MRLRAQVESTAMLGLVAAGRQCCALVLPSSTRAWRAAASQSGCFSRSSRRSDGRQPLSVGSSWSHQQQHRLTTYRTIEERPHVPRHLRSTTVDLAEGEEEIATVDVSPEEIAAFFEQPSYEAAQAGGKQLPGATATLLESNPRHIHVLDGFLQQPLAAQLRAVFDERFSKPREGTAERFVWDWWHVPEQYTLMRTPAEEYFGPEGFEALTAALCKFGQEQLGCRAISPPWLSVYIDGCEQRFHTDAWHGPWAFVLSLTDWDDKDFTGGETQILKPHVLNYWNSFAPGIGLEEKHFLDTIEPHFNRLTLFDPRFPHGVKPVRGTRDPRCFTAGSPTRSPTSPAASLRRRLRRPSTEPWRPQGQRWLQQRGAGSPAR
eukprot:TRINITY_DN246_c0_g1_i3.p1 TRINITY_DN246_c0_g1~~TRINITY_DN246_c0_g1_i3.p1  ORF type:complete len:376 (-),score=68.45 TRINITY_DN246_c0_g1_i3:549-1676(-)